jgi:sialic acid synthase SpsE
MDIIADLSLNFQCLDDILEMVQTVRCEYIKLQWYSEKDLYGKGLTSTKLDQDWIPTIANECRKNKKKFLCTVFSHERVNFINKYVSAHKIASSEITDKDLLFAIKQTKKNIILSTGGASQGGGYVDQIREALSILNPLINNICLMACDVEYPSKRHNIRKMLQLKNRYQNVTVGYSDHSLDIYSMPILCKHYSAELYEKHVKPNHHHSSFEEHALTVDEFNEMWWATTGRESDFIKNPHQRVYSHNLKRWVRPKNEPV